MKTQVEEEKVLRVSKISFKMLLKRLNQ